MPYDVFISYASEDIAFAQDLNDRLVNEGFKTWFDKVRLYPGFDWYFEIEQGCENSRVILPILTPRWKISEWTKYETYGAEAVIPVLFEGSWNDVATPPLERFQAEVIDIKKQSEADWNRLFTGIRRICDSQFLEKTARLTHMHYRANDNFTGRKKELIQIHEELHTKPKTGLTSGRVRAIVANGGYGKTTLVRQYVEKFWKCYKQIFWVDCRLGLEREFSHIHDFLFPEKKNLGLKDQDKAASALNELNNNINRLLILDNADELEEQIIDWIPKIGSCHTLVTSRFGAFGGAIKTIHIFVLEKGPSVEFLKKRTGRDLKDMELAACELLAEKLGYLPLALEQAAAYIEQQGEYFGFQNYLLLYDNAIKDLLNIKTPGTTEYPDSVFATWKSTIARLSFSGRAILHLSSYLASVPIPVELFIKVTNIICEYSDSVYGGKSLYENNNNEAWMRGELAKLNAYSMINYNGHSFTIHPLLKLVEILSDSKEVREITFNHVVAVLIKISPPASWEGDSRRLYNLSNEKFWSQILSHVINIEKLCKEFKIPIESDKFLYLSVNAYASNRLIDSAWERCSLLIEKLRYNCNRMEDEYLKVLKAFAYLQKYKKFYTEAFQSFDELYNTRVKLYGEKSRLALHARHQIAVLMHFLGNSTDSEKVMNEVLIDQIQTLGNDDYETIVSMHNIGWLLSYSNLRWRESELYFRKAYEYWRKTVGIEILDTRNAAENLADVLSKKGDYIQAEKVQRVLLEETEAIFGKDHFDCLRLKQNLSYYVKNLGDIENAYKLTNEVVNGYRKSLSPDHQDLLAALNELVAISIKLERYSEAEHLMQEAVTGYEKTKGLDADITLRTVRNLAGLLDIMGRSDMSKPLHLRMVKATISNKDITPLELRQAALDCFNLGDYVLAESCLVRVLNEKFEISGTNCHLARVCIVTDRFSSAQAHIEQAWLHRTEAKNYVIARILWIKIALEFLDSSSNQNFIRQLKAVLQKEDAIMNWPMQPV
jgi:hypothetical protein